jgi:hypothetical protein
VVGWLLVACSDVVISDTIVDNIDECIEVLVVLVGSNDDASVLIDDVVATVVVIWVVDVCREEFSVELEILLIVAVVVATSLPDEDAVISIGVV